MLQTFRPDDRHDPRALAQSLTQEMRRWRLDCPSPATHGLEQAYGDDFGVLGYCRLHLQELLSSRGPAGTVTRVFWLDGLHPAGASGSRRPSAD